MMRKDFPLEPLISPWQELMSLKVASVIPPKNLPNDASPQSSTPKDPRNHLQLALMI